jgi:hypothetical protein
MSHTPVITPPVVNLNGSSKGALLDQNVDVIVQLRATKKAMQAAFPHGRDFQTSTSDCLKAAAFQAKNRMDIIDRLIADYEALAEAIANQ